MAADRFRILTPVGMPRRSSRSGGAESPTPLRSLRRRGHRGSAWSSDGHPPLHRRVGLLLGEPSAGDHDGGGPAPDGLAFENLEVHRIYRPPSPAIRPPRGSWRSRLPARGRLRRASSRRAESDQFLYARSERETPPWLSSISGTTVGR